jgi:hypothetical protein
VRRQGGGARVEGWVGRVRDEARSERGRWNSAKFFC